jgi:hypothetical protein
LTARCVSAALGAVLSARKSLPKERRLAQIEESVARYLSQLDTADRQTAAGEAPSEELVARTARLKEKLIKLEEEVKLGDPMQSKATMDWLQGQLVVPK